MRPITTKTLLLVAILVATSVSAEVLSLQDCREIALKNAESIAIAKLEVENGKALMKASFTVFLPSLNATGSYLHSGKTIEYKEDLNLRQLLSGMAQANPAVTSDPFYQTLAALFQQGMISDKIDLQIGEKDNWILGFELLQPIFTGGKIIEQCKLAKTGEKLANAQLRQAQSELLYQTDEAFWRVISLQEKEKLAQSYQKLVQKHVDDLNNAYEQGIVTQNELLKAKVKLEEAKLGLLQANNGQKLALMALNRLLGIELEAATELEYQPLNEVQFTIPEIEGILESRPDYQMLQRQKDICNSLNRIAKSRYYPNIGLQGNFHTLKPDVYNSMEHEFGSGWQIGIVAQMELFHFGERHQDVTVTKNNLKASELKLQETRELIELQIQSCANQLTEANSKLEISKASLQQAEENLRICQARFQEGMLRSSELLEAQSLWQKSYSDKIDSEMDLNLKNSAYLKAIDELK